MQLPERLPDNPTAEQLLEYARLLRECPKHYPHRPAPREVEADEPIIVDDGEDGSVFMDWPGLTGTWSRVGPPLPQPELPPGVSPDCAEFTDANGVTWYRRGRWTGV